MAEVERHRGVSSRRFAEWIIARPSPKSSDGMQLG
jgi:hypothetical protein